MWQPYIAIDAGKDIHGLAQARIITLEVVDHESDAWQIAKEAFINTPNSVSFSINKV